MSPAHDTFRAMPPKKTKKQIQKDIDEVLAGKAAPRGGLEDASPHEFAQAVLDTIPRVGSAPNERFGSQKVFISALYRRMAKDGYNGGLDTFKQQLLAARRAGLLNLLRADLIGAMPGAAVDASETGAGSSAVHFVRDPTAKNPW